ncbi:MAG TPA: hypothetical protein VLN25_02825 [Burkholderiaceae bacterium]|nr:hypothetical protein [Burkholderiaceae bacterium]
MKVKKRLGSSTTSEPALPNERDQRAARPAAPRSQGRRAYADATSGRVDTDTRGSQLLQLAHRLKARRP